MKELVRCRPCGYVMEAHKLGYVCHACRLPAKVFEPYRERVSTNRKMILNIDLHSIAIHLSQTCIILIPLLSIIINFFGSLHYELLRTVIVFSVFCFPFTLALAIVTGMIDGYIRFKTYKTPLLRGKIIYSIIIFILATAIFFVGPHENYGIITILISLLCLATGIRLGLWRKKLINVILPGTFPKKKVNKEVGEKEVVLLSILQSGINYFINWLSSWQRKSCRVLLHTAACIKFANYDRLKYSCIILSISTL